MGGWGRWSHLVCKSRKLKTSCTFHSNPDTAWEHSISSKNAMKDHEKQTKHKQTKKGLEREGRLWWEVHLNGNRDGSLSSSSSSFFYKHDLETGPVSVMGKVRPLSSNSGGFFVCLYFFFLLNLISEDGGLGHEDGLSLGIPLSEDSSLFFNMALVQKWSLIKRTGFQWGFYYPQTEKALSLLFVLTWS